MKAKRLLSLIMVVVFCFTLLSACGGNNNVNSGGNDKEEVKSGEKSQDDSKADAKEKFKVGVSFFSLKALFPATIKDAMVAYVEEKGLDKEIELITLDARDDSATQVGQIDNLIAQKVDVIILNPMSADSLVPAVEAAKEAGIPIFTVNAEVNTDLITTHVGSNDVVAGELEMQYLADQIDGKGNIVIVHGPNGISAEVLRREGYENILKKYPDIKILAEPTANWSRAEALAVAENMIQTHEKIDAFVCQNDEMAMGALKAVEENDLLGKTFVGGIDAIPDACQAVKDGKLTCTVFQDAIGQAQGAIDVAMKILKGEEVEKRYDIPFILVDQKNVDKYMD